MSVSLFTPKQVAQALGVSESSVKRWVDSGRLPAARTAGGHRKVPLPSIVRYVRASGHELSRPEVLGMVTATQRGTPEKATGLLFDALVSGDETKCRELVLGFYLGGATFADLGDRLIGPVFGMIGEGWAAGRTPIRQERRGCEAMMATLHELRRWMPPLAAEAPLAIVATPFDDFAQLPARLVELVLLSAGWRVTHAGCGLPLEEIRDEAMELRPRLVCLSVTHLVDPEGFATQYNQTLAMPTRAALGDASTADGVSHVIGGGAVEPVSDGIDCDLYSRSLTGLASHEAKLRGRVA